ncbi:MAG TPA: CsbD family protein [Gaiellaceae bacterium]|nr:CsbD family protein [Gaiellaceae bacterium]
MPVDAVHRRMFERLQDRGFSDFDPAHLIVFQWPGPDGARPSELAARLQISKQALNYLLGQLERLGYLERRPDPDDQRGKRIAVTERGRAAIRVIRDAVHELETAWAEQLTPERFAELKALLVDLNQLTAARFPMPAAGRQRSSPTIGAAMDKDEAKGRAKEAAGDLTGDKDLQREGKADQAAGKVKEGVDDAADKVKETMRDD